MITVLIAYNNDENEKCGHFFEDCATDIRNHCLTHGVDVQLLTPPDLTEEKFSKQAATSQICYIASHGSPNSVLNEKGEDFISTNTANYSLNGQCFFSVSCHCAKELKDALFRIGLKLFVGYNNTYTFFPNCDEFTQSANSGLKAFIEGMSVAQMKEYIYAEYDRLYKVLDKKSAIMADALLDNKEAIIVEGEDTLTINDLV